MVEQQVRAWVERRLNPGFDSGVNHVANQMEAKAFRPTHRMLSQILALEPQFGPITPITALSWVFCHAFDLTVRL